MVWQQALYLVNLLCKFVPCDYNFPYPDTSLSEPQAFKNLISIGFNTGDKGHPDSLRIGDWDQDPHAWIKEGLDYTKSDPLVVITKTGKLRGFWMRVVGGRKIRAFEGIPYAEPPIGYFRFNEPSPKISWTGLFHANKKGPKCLQYGQIELQRAVGSEDCLLLNIYSPQVDNGPSGKNASKFGVLVYIHGGGFQVGSGGDFGPSYLLQQDLILVTFNWRVGIFGFLSTGDSISPGNYGLKDQALALRWVYDNIVYFNGDPNLITLFGHEAGAASVHLQMISSKARNYFQAGISMSGSAYSPWVFHSKEDAKDLAKHFAKTFNCPSHSSEAIVSCLRRCDALTLAKKQIKFLDDWPLPIYLFRPVIEDSSQKEEPFLSETPDEVYKKDNVAKIPWIAGFTEDEGLTFLLPAVFRGNIKQLRANWNHLAPDFLDYEHLDIDKDEITKKVNWLYFKQKDPMTAPIKTFSDALSSRFTITGVHKGLQAHCQKAPAYGYMFAYNGKYNLATLAGIKPKEWGVGQGEDTFYLLNSTHLYQGFKKSDHELILSKIMVNLFGNFANKRIPSFTLENHEDFQIWDPITDPRNMSFLLIHKKIKMIPEPYLKQTIYWESIGLPDTIPLINSSEHYHDFHPTVGTTTPAPIAVSTPNVFDLRSHFNNYQSTERPYYFATTNSPRAAYNAESNAKIFDLRSAKSTQRPDFISTTPNGLNTIPKSAEFYDPVVVTTHRPPEIPTSTTTTTTKPKIATTTPTPSTTSAPLSDSKFEVDNMNSIFLPPFPPYVPSTSTTSEPETVTTSIPPSQIDIPESEIIELNKIPETTPSTPNTEEQVNNSPETGNDLPREDTNIQDSPEMIKDDQPDKVEEDTLEITTMRPYTEELASPETLKDEKLDPQVQINHSEINQENIPQIVLPETKQENISQTGNDGHSENKHDEKIIDTENLNGDKNEKNVTKTENVLPVVKNQVYSNKVLEEEDNSLESDDRWATDGGNTFVTKNSKFADSMDDITDFHSKDQPHKKSPVIPVALSDDKPYNIM